jgi:uncharacterized DUF497 family protein
VSPTTTTPGGQRGGGSLKRHAPLTTRCRSDVPEQYLAVGWVGDRLHSVIFEVREDEDGEILHLVTLWRSTKEEIRLYEENS